MLERFTVKTVVLPRWWVPEHKTLSNVYTGDNIPTLGTNTHVRLAEMYVASQEREPTDLNIVGTGLKRAELLNNLISFYSPQCPIGTLYSLYDESSPEDNQEKIVEALWLSNHYEPTRIVSLIKTIDQLRQDSLTRLHPGSIIPTYEELDKFLDMSLWFNYHNFHPGLEFTWVVSQEWEQKDVQEILTITEGDLSKIIPLLEMGADSDFIKTQLLDENGGIPGYWYDVFRQAMSEQNNKEESS